MNFLAHLYLSDNKDDIMIGNFIADHVQGKEMFIYNEAIQKGILLHRAIDEFTDRHPVVKKSKERLHARYRHYDGVIIDIFYDHFLAKKWSTYSSIPLPVFADYFYHLLKQMEQMPQRTERFFHYMKMYNLLVNYREMDTIAQVLDGMNRRSKMKSQMHLAIIDLEEYYDDFEADFLVFFEDLRQFAGNKLTELEDTHS